MKEFSPSPPSERASLEVALAEIRSTKKLGGESHRKG